jgi:hypothetical protein
MKVNGWLFLRTKVGSGIFTPPFGELVHESDVDNVNARVVAELRESDLVASLTPVHGNIVAGGCIERCDGGGQEAEGDRPGEHRRTVLILGSDKDIVIVIGRSVV